jgi:hypothetical protein
MMRIRNNACISFRYCRANSFLQNLAFLLFCLRKVNLKIVFIAFSGNFCSKKLNKKIRK